MDARSCLHCGATLEGKADRAKYCSRQCHSRASANRCTARKRGHDVPLIEYRSARPTCPWCGEQVARAQRTYCNPEHARLDRQRHKQVVHVPAGMVTALPKPESKAPKIRPPRLFHAGWCVECGAAFISPTAKPTQFCSNRCIAKSGKAKRRAVLRDAFVEPVRRKVAYERDDYVCQLCMQPCDRDAVVPDPLAPTIDHVLALANGGAHSMANVQTAHFRCNYIKSDRDPTSIEFVAA